MIGSEVVANDVCAGEQRGVQVSKTPLLAMFTTQSVKRKQVITDTQKQIVMLCNDECVLWKVRGDRGIGSETDMENEGAIAFAVPIRDRAFRRTLKSETNPSLPAFSDRRSLQTSFQYLPLLISTHSHLF
jgi:hypothetical protein